MWQCPNCKREFQKNNQSHSCRPAIPIEKHFEGKPKAKELFDHLKQKIEQEVGPFTLDSPACCIHFVQGITFCACWPIKDHIRIDFFLTQEQKIDRAFKIKKFSTNRFVYYLDIMDKKEIDKELVALIKKSYDYSK
jgi:hypothetical protein